MNRHLLLYERTTTLNCLDDKKTVLKRESRYKFFITLAIFEFLCSVSYTYKDETSYNLNAKDCLNICHEIWLIQ